MLRHPQNLDKQNRKMLDCAVLLTLDLEVSTKVFFLNSLGAGLSEALWLFIIWPHAWGRKVLWHCMAEWLSYWKHNSTAVQTVAATASSGLTAPLSAEHTRIKLRPGRSSLIIPHCKHNDRFSSPFYASLLWVVLVMDLKPKAWPEAKQMLFICDNLAWTLPNKLL